MSRRRVSGMMLTLLLVCMLSLAFDIQPVKTDPNTIIVPDDYPTIQEAINSANDKDVIFVRNGTYYENIVISKSLTVIGEDCATTIIDGNYTGNVVKISAGDVDITGFTIRRSGGPIPSSGFRVHSGGNTITDNIIEENQVGIYLYLSGCLNNSILGNKILSNEYHGILAVQSSNNTINDNHIEMNSNHGIWLDVSANNNNIHRNNLSSNTMSGIMLSGSSNNNDVRENNMEGNYRGLDLRGHSSDNIIHENTVRDNNYAVQIDESSNNILRHNSFVNNSYQILMSTGCINLWDDGYPSGGNYWSDGSHSDSNGDGIADTPYIIDVNNTDRYPLMSQYWYWENPMVGDLNRDMKVDIKDIAIVTIAYGSYPGHPKWNPHADITGPTYLVPDGKIDIRDIALIAIHYGEVYT